MLLTTFAATALALFSQQALSYPQTTTSSSTQACNNSPDLCSKTYDQVTYLGAHDSPFVSDASNSYTVSGNQYYNSTIQLSAGVRLLSAQVHNNNGSLDLCHTSCDLLNAGSLSDWLGEVKTWMDSNPNEVVTLLIVNSDDTSAQDLGNEFVNAQISNYGFTLGQSWPTLSSMISSGKRLVTFVASITTSSQYPYLLNEFDHVFENPYSYTDPSTFSCTADRPSSDTSTLLSEGRLPLQNHFLDANEGSLFGSDVQIPNVPELGSTNAPAGSVNGTNVGSLAQTTKNCTTYWGRQPSFVLVDYFNVGPAIDTVDSLNGVTNPVGRMELSDANPPPAMSSDGLRARPTARLPTIALVFAFVYMVVA